MSEDAFNLEGFGVEVDLVLCAELEHPGTDQRHGVNVICRPPAAVRDLIAGIQDSLRSLEPEQYFYPTSDIHLTLFEVCHTRSQACAARLAAVVAREMPNILRRLPAPVLSDPVVTFDRRACALRLKATDARLDIVRKAIQRDLDAVGVAAAPRYDASSAHVTFLRYVSNLKYPNDRWVNWLQSAAVTPIETTWDLNQAWVTWGATWYGMRSRIESVGPMPLGGG